MAKYQIETDDGAIYEVETDEPETSPVSPEPAAPEAAPPSWLKKITDTARSLLPKGAGAVGGLLPGILGPATEAIASDPKQAASIANELLPAVGGGVGVASPIPGGAALGTMAGTAASQVGRRILSDKPFLDPTNTGARPVSLPIVGDIPQIPKVGPEASEILTQGGLSVLGDMAGKLVSMPWRGAAALSKKAADLVRKVPKGDKFLTPAEKAVKKPLAQFEATLERSPFTSGAMEEFKTARRAKLDNIADINNPQGLPGSTIGSKLQEAVETSSKTKFNALKERFNAFGQKMEGQTIKMDRLRQTAANLLDQKLQSPSASQDTKSISFLRRILGDTVEKSKSNLLGPTGKPLKDVTRPKDFSFAEYQQFRADQNRLIAENNAALGTNAPKARGFTSPQGAVYSQLKKAADEDVAAHVEKQGGKLWEEYKTLNADYSDAKRLYTGSTIKKAIKSNPEDVVDAMFGPKKFTEIQELKKTVDRNSFVEFQRKAMNKLFTPSREGQSLTEALTNNLRRYDDETLKAAFGETYVENLKALSKIQRQINLTARMSGNPSGTGQAMVSAGTLAYVIRHPIRGTIMYLSGPKLVEAYLNPLKRQSIQRALINLSRSSKESAKGVEALTTAGILSVPATKKLSK